MQIETTPAVIRNDLSEIRSTIFLERDNGNVHRAAANIIVSKSRAARGSVCNVLLSRVTNQPSMGTSNKNAPQKECYSNC